MRGPSLGEALMLEIDSIPEASTGADPGRLILYLEGPRDRAILRGWSFRLLPSFGRRVFGSSVILGGRRPRRALEHFRDAGGMAAGLRGLCVLDRDDGSAGPPPGADEPGLEFFTWGRRHIESYLLIPAAIRRSLRFAEGDLRVHRALREVLPRAADESALANLDAKRILGPNGALPRALGRPIPLQGVARATRCEELHPDVHQLFDQMRQRLGVRDYAAR